MNDTTQSSPEMDNETGMSAALREQRRLARRIGWRIWAEQVRETNPDVDPKEDTVGWEEVREKQTKLGVKVLKILESEGFNITPA